MKMQCLRSWALSAAIVLVPALVFAQSSNYKAPRTPDGQPDLQGYWNSETFTPFERPAEFKDKAFFTPAEAEAYQHQRTDQADNQPETDVHYDNRIWQSEKQGKGLSGLRTSLVIDPADGRIPPVTAEAKARPRTRYDYDSVKDRPLAERCIIWPHEGPPMVPVGYNSNLSFAQGPGYVAITQEMIHDTRVIPLDGRPHIGAAIREYMGDSVGHWEGDTLVIETTNFTDRTQFRGSTASLKVTERIRRTDDDTILYQATIEDPHTWTRPWTIEYQMHKTNDPIFEYACHEGNYGMRNTMMEQRHLEEQAKKAKAAQTSTNQ